ncbi:zinc finger protein, partial [Rhizoctonia solani]
MGLKRMPSGGTEPLTFDPSSNMATNHIPVPAAQAALSLLSLSSGLSSSTPPPSQSTPTSAPTLGRFVHSPRSTASVVRPSPVAPSPASTPSAGRRRPSSTTLTKRRTSDATRGDSLAPGSSTDTPAAPEANGGKAKKGTIFKCETYIAIQIVWSNIDGSTPPIGERQAAAILSHISPAKNGMGTSLPEDRSLWPAYLSGGLLPMPTAGTSAPVTPAAPSTTAYREREASVATSVVEDDEDMGGSSDEREDSGYGSSSAALAVPGRPQPRPHQTYGIATSIGGHEYTLSSSHAGCDAGAHIGSMAYQFSIGRSMSASSFGVSSLRGRDDEDEEEPEGAHDDHNHTHTNGNGRKWDEDESMAMDMDL